MWLLPFVIISLGQGALSILGKADSQSQTLNLRDILKVKLMYFQSNVEEPFSFGQSC